VGERVEIIIVLYGRLQREAGGRTYGRANLVFALPNRTAAFSLGVRMHNCHPTLPKVLSAYMIVSLLIHIQDILLVQSFQLFLEAYGKSRLFNPNPVS